MPEAGSIRYVSVGSRDGSRAAGALRAGKRIPAAGELPGIVTNPVSASPVAVTPVTTPADPAPAPAPAPATATPPATAGAQAPVAATPPSTATPPAAATPPASAPTAPPG
jgi:hypothetical protein